MTSLKQNITNKKVALTKAVNERVEYERTKNADSAIKQVKAFKESMNSEATLTMFAELDLDFAIVNRQLRKNARTNVKTLTRIARICDALNDDSKKLAHFDFIASELLKNYIDAAKRKLSLNNNLARATISRMTSYSDAVKLDQDKRSSYNTSTANAQVSSFNDALVSLNLAHREKDENNKDIVVLHIDDERLAKLI